MISRVYDLFDCWPIQGQQCNENTVIQVGKNLVYLEHKIYSKPLSDLRLIKWKPIQSFQTQEMNEEAHKEV